MRPPQQTKENLQHQKSPLEKCRNAFFSGLLAIEQGFPSFLLTEWINGEWSIFLGPEHLAKGMLIGRAKAYAESVSWRAFPSRDGWLGEPYSPRQIAEWVLNKQNNKLAGEDPHKEYSN